MTNIEEVVKCSKNLTLLYVEDNQATRDSALMILSEFFDDIILGVDGHDGFNKFQQNNIDLIITDINMPVLNGLNMSKKIKELNPTIPILVVSAHNEPEYFIDSIKVGIDGYLLKPLHFDQFCSTLYKTVTNIQNDIEVKINKENQQKYKKQKALGTMLNNIAHHWRQPLSVISTLAGSIELTNENGIATKENNIKYSQSIMKSTELLNKMIEDFRILFNDINHDKIVQIDFNKIINCIISNVHDVEFIVDVEDIIMNEHEVFIENILTHICNNAIEATKDISTKSLIFINIFKQNNKINIVVRDNGLGIKEDILDKIFEPYFTTKHKYFGTGLSLYVVDYIVTQHLNGTIEVKNVEFEHENIPYTGTTFKIILGEY